MSNSSRHKTAANQTNKKNTFAPRSSLLALEVRTLFDGAALFTADAYSEHHAEPQQSHESSQDSIQTFATTDNLPSAIGSINNSGPATGTIAEHSSLNEPGSDSLSLSQWQIQGDPGAPDTVYTLTVTVNSETEGQPGHLQLSTSPEQSYQTHTLSGTASEINAQLAQLLFRSSPDHELGAEAAEIELSFELKANDTLISTRSFNITITPSNSPVEFRDSDGQPIDTVHATVQEGGSLVLTPELLGTYDSELEVGAQNASQITYKIGTLQEHGYLVRYASSDATTGARLGVGSVFTHAELEAGLIRYVHTAKETDTQNASTSFTLTANDGATALDKSASLSVELTVTPVNQEVTLEVYPAYAWEGQPHNAQNANQVGLSIQANNGGDPDDKLWIVITRLPTAEQGTLYFDGQAITELSDPAGYRIAYADRHLLTYAAQAHEQHGQVVSIDFRIEDSGGGTDQISTKDGTLNIYIQDVNDDPVLDTNAGAGTDRDTWPTLNEDKQGYYSLTLGNEFLAASDPDNTDGQLTYKVTQIPEHGALVRVIGDDLYRMELGATFTQEDIDNGLIRFVQTSDVSALPAEQQFSQFKFELIDNTVSMFWDADGQPYTRPGGDYGQQTGADAPLQQHEFNLNLNTQPWTNPGSLVIHELEIEFQGDVNHGGHHNSLETQVGAAVSEGGVLTLNKEHLHYSATIKGGSLDGQPQPSDQIIYTIMGFGLDSSDKTSQEWGNGWNGVIKLNGVPLGLYNSFTQADIDNGDVTFEHNGSENFLSNLQLQVSSPTYGAPYRDPETFNFEIYVTPVNDAPEVQGEKRSCSMKGKQKSTLRSTPYASVIKMMQVAVVTSRIKPLIRIWTPARQMKTSRWTTATNTPYSIASQNFPSMASCFM